MRKFVIMAIVLILIMVNGNEKGIHQKSIPVGDVEYKTTNHAPVALINVSRMGKMFIFDASQSYDPDGNTLRYRWDFNNDGTWDTPWLDNPKIKHIYSCRYNKFVRLEVDDGTQKDDCILRIITESNGSVDQKQEREDGYAKIYGNKYYAQSFKPGMIGFDGIDLLIERKGMILPLLLKKIFSIFIKIFHRKFIHSNI